MEGDLTFLFLFLNVYISAKMRITGMFRIILYQENMFTHYKYLI